MGKKIKKGKEGPVKEYVSRTKALKKLQVNLKDFRRLCILKGIYPREPPQKLRKQHKTYYHNKDIAFLKNESILDTFRQRQAHLKKIRKALTRGDKLKAGRLRRNQPKDKLDHLVKERYPTFIDALNDLDDPLCLVSLFASFPTHKELHIPNTLIRGCQKLLSQFLLYVSANNCLRKVFLSIKGIYYQAVVQGATITWIMPYPIQASLPLDVDYKIMMTFLEFYQVLMKFVNFKLLGQDIEITDFSEEVKKLKSVSQNNQIEIDEAFKEDPTIQQMDQQQQETKKYSELFKGLTFFLYPEVPKTSLEFVILSFGGEVMWENDNKNSQLTDPKITHIITERQIQKNKKREYIQPQWVYDSINQLKLLSVADYAPESTLPPHLSPFEQLNLEEVQSESEEEDGQQKEHKPYQNNKKQKEKQAKQQEKETKKLAETMLSRKNKRLYDMIKRKEDEEKQKKNKLQEKKKMIQSKQQ
ncbi:unnamed protein product (macronuclear) [Paramecium tetraurelia]|uniref:Pescadillo homolog n=1 Tax=Paramecium tetraurelia TaxID=5888 RepID=A0DEJ7_PARTE|nr:uncharacterized protein GSPATT00016290001 [Paramecium tetraurelia]CAK81464.1 unnamed protein product [Paramecium tetraurelia]|eukprot:XP_001448861.1 hypothetical protein (macronuclear) [Paramecium tetraurelia strain d4-2]